MQLPTIQNNVVNSIRSSDRVAFVGKTGSGKTYAARLLALNIPRLIAMDPKGTLGQSTATDSWNLSEYDRNTKRKLMRGNDIRVRIPAPVDNNWEPFFELAYNAQDVTVYIDELYGVLNMRRVPPRYLTACYTRGRELNIGVWSATQRPTWVPLFALSEADWLFLFRLQLDADRRRMSEIMGDEVRDTELRNHNVIVYHQSWEAVKQFDRIDARKALT